ncbi:unnamed protein product [Spirodela intermedia]|uniref:RNase H type-1 domain-containing protein n=1 Tax=Spirodela intermedia TaxID=51605 RepID=A0A7I8IJI2_SPIIN|nr:unnamed protein product [Spirodela intermedia]CAA6658045.1 unnamed protein product [Spirodela intermedia]
MCCSMLGVSHFTEKLIQWTPYTGSELRASSEEAVLRHSRRRAMKSSLHGISFAALGRSACCSGVRLSTSDLLFAKLPRWCYSTRRKSAPRVPKMEHQESGEKQDAFYVVRKGDLVGVYKSFKECQEQLSSFVCDPAVSVYKGYSLRKETEKYLASRGLKNAMYTIHSADVREDVFGALVPCSIQKICHPLRLLGVEGQTPDNPRTADLAVKHTELVEKHSLHSKDISCIIEFDGASKGNPGRAGAGAVIRSEDGTVIYRLREGLGVATNNVAEYRAMILGMRCALKKGFKQIRIQGDSKLVCNQLSGVWRTRHKNLINLNKEAMELKEKFLSFDVRHVKREFNSDADAEANSAVDLPNGEVQELSVEP